MSTNEFTDISFNQIASEKKRLNLSMVNIESILDSLQTSQGKPPFCWTTKGMSSPVSPVASLTNCFMSDYVYSRAKNDLAIIEKSLTELHEHMTSCFSDSAETFSDSQRQEALLVGFRLLQEREALFWQAKNPSHTLTCFAHFFAYALILFKSALNSNIGNKNRYLTLITDFLSEVERYLVNVLQDAYRSRKQAVTLRLAGPYDELIYLYDHQTERSLTKWVNFDPENAALIHQAALWLGERISQDYIRKIDIAIFFDALQVLDENSSGYHDAIMAIGNRNQPWLQTDDEGGHSAFHQPEVDNKLAGLLLPGLVSDYAPELLPPKPYDYDWKLIIQAGIIDINYRTASTLIANGVAAKAGKLMKLAASVLSSGAVAFLGPIAALLYELILPPDSFTMDDVKKEIKRLVGEGISNHSKFTILQWLTDVELSKSELEATTRDFEANPTAENKIKLTLARRDFYHKSLQLSHRYFSPDPELEAYAIHYKLGFVYQLVIIYVNTAITLYLAEGHDVNLTKDILNNYRRFINDSYAFLDKLYNQAWERQGYRGIRVDRVHPLTGPWHWAHDFVNGRQLSTKINGNPYWLQPYSELVDEKSRFFATESAGVYNSSLLHTSISQEFSTLMIKLGDKLGSDFNQTATPSAVNQYWANHNWRIYNTLLPLYSKSGEGSHYNSQWYHLGNKPGYRDAHMSFYDLHTRELINESGLGCTVSLRTLLKASKEHEREVTYTLPFGVRTELVRYDNGVKVVAYHPSNKELIGTTFHIHTYYWSSANFYIDLEFYYGLNSLAHFTTEKGKQATAII